MLKNIPKMSQNAPRMVPKLSKYFQKKTKKNKKTPKIVQKLSRETENVDKKYFGKVTPRSMF